jgi:ATPase family AAA domain-containing protein 2
VVQLFKEVRGHQPSIIFIPNVDIWYKTVGSVVIRTLTGLLQSLRSDEKVMVLGVCEGTPETKRNDQNMLRDLFGYSLKNVYDLPRPDDPARREFFKEITEYIRKAPSEFPHPENRRKRKLEILAVAPEETPPKPDGEAIKAARRQQRKQDRVTLNKLKVSLQPIMDNIKKGHRKFRNPIVDTSLYPYLYDDMDQERISSDIPLHQRRERNSARLYEIGRDKKGVRGLLEVDTGKFYYNLETVTIERRLANGYYKRPKDFLADIRTLRKDAVEYGLDPERIIKAGELEANVEVDIASLENTQPALVMECEAVYAREKERAREARKAAQQAAQEVIRADLSRPISSHNLSNPDAAGPIVLSDEAAAAADNDAPPSTPTRPARNINTAAGKENLDNKEHDDSSKGLSNGSKHVGNEHDAEMVDVAERSSFEDNLASPAFDATASQTFQHTQPRSQVSASTYLPKGSQPGEYHNSASTTTSGGPKTSHSSNRSSGWTNSQSTNGVSGQHHPDFSMMVPQPGSSQLPDTQEPASQLSNSQHSQSSQMAPPRHAGSINAILNNTEQPKLILDEIQLKNLSSEIARLSSGFSVEQLQQVNAHLMEAIWTTRNEWNRNIVIHHVKDTFNEVAKDIEAVQAVLPPSQDDNDDED